jgi:hypothetical protein
MRQFGIGFYWTITGLFMGGGIPMIGWQYPELAYGFWAISVVMLIIGLIHLQSEKKLESITKAFSKSKVVWGLWHTGTEINAQQLISNPKLTRILVLSTDRDDIGLKTSTILARRNEPNGAIAEINEISEKAGRKAKHYNMPLSYSLTFFDKTPIKNNKGELEPCSKNAWIVIQVFEPQIASRDRTKYVVKNKGGESKKKFEGFYRLFNDLWDE